MPKNSWNDYSATAASNTDVGGINCDEGMAPSNVNDCIRELMSHTAEVVAGTTALSSINIDGGSITGITDLAVADGGTGASTAAAARSNLSAAASGANTDITSLTANAMTPSGGTLNVTGNVTASGNVTAYSAAAAKDDIVQIPNALELVERMRGVSFRWKHEDERTLGLIYEEVKEAVPELTREENGMVSVMYQNTVALLIEAVKTLKAEVDELKGARK